MPINAADTAWLLISTALVMLMTPGLALFYGGMVRSKNVLSTIMMSFMSLGVIGILWTLYGYSLAFGTDCGGIIGGFDYLGLKCRSRSIPDICNDCSALGVYDFSNDVCRHYSGLDHRLSSGKSKIQRHPGICNAMVYPGLLSSSPLGWGGGWLAKLGALDFAGGMVVHITAGVSAFAMAFLLGPRKGYYDGTPMSAHNVPLVVIGAGLLWFGWFGFNAGSALTSGGLPPVHSSPPICRLPRERPPGCC